MALLTLKDIYKKQGNEFIDDLFKSYVIVSEQIDGSRFMFQKHFDDSLIFYKKTGVQINHIDRTLMSFYEKAINYISALSVDKLDKIPDNWTFGFQYFPSLAPINVVYDKLPKNNLILTDISIRNDSGRVIKVINDPKVLRDWANILEVELPPIIYEGYLSDEQKEKIRSFLEVNDQDLTALFKSQSFTRYIISILNPKMKTTALSNSIDKDIEGIVFKFIKPGETEYFSAKVIDPVFHYHRKQLRSNAPRKSNDMYQIAMLDIVEFIEQFDLEDIMLTSELQEERYVELMSQLFNEYVSTSGHKYVGVDFDTPDFAKRPEFNINISNIKNARTKEILDNDHMRNLYKIILSSFRKHRKNATDILTSTVIGSINNIVDNIEAKVRVQIKGDIALDFDTFLKTAKYRDEKSMFEQEIFEGITIDHPEQGLKKVNFVSGRYQPFTIGHVKVFQELYKKNGLSVVVGIVRGSKPDPDRNPFQEDLQLRMFAALQKQYKFLEAAVILPTSSIDKIYNKVRPAYEPVLWGAGTDRVKSYQQNINKYGDELNVLPELKMYETKRNDGDVSATRVRKALAIEDKPTFNKYTPKAIHKFFQELSEIVGVNQVVAENIDIITEGEISLAVPNPSEKLIVNETSLEAKKKMESILFRESLNEFLEDLKSYPDIMNEDIDGALDRLQKAVNSIDIPDEKAEQRVVTQLTDTAEYIENFKPISDIHSVFVEEKGFSEGDFEGIVKILKKDNEESLNNFSTYLQSPYGESYFTSIKAPVNLGNKMSKDIGVSATTLNYILKMDGKMKGGKGVGRGELFLGLMIDGASNASVGDVNVNGNPYEVKGNQARLNTQNGFGNGTSAIVAFMAELQKIDPVAAKKFAIKGKKDVASFNLKKSGSRLYDILHEVGDEIGNTFDEKKKQVVKAAADVLFCGPSGIWPQASSDVRKKVTKALTDFAKVKNKYSQSRDIFNYTMMYNNIIYYQSQEYFNGLFLVEPSNGHFAYFDVSKDNVKWLMKNTTYTAPSFQDNPTSNCWKITIR